MIKENGIKGYAQKPYLSAQVVEHVQVHNPEQERQFLKPWMTLRKLHGAGNTPVSIARAHGHHVSQRARTGLIRETTSMQCSDSTSVMKLGSIERAIRETKYPELKRMLTDVGIRYYNSLAFENEADRAEFFKFLVQQLKRLPSPREKAETIAAFFVDAGTTPERSAPIFEYAMGLIPKLSNTEQQHLYHRLSQNLRCVPQAQRIDFVDAVQRSAATLTPDKLASHIEPLLRNLANVPEEQQQPMIDNAISLMNNVSDGAKVQLVLTLMGKLAFMLDHRKKTVINNAFDLMSVAPNEANVRLGATLMDNLRFLSRAQKKAIINKSITLLNVVPAADGVRLGVTLINNLDLMSDKQKPEVINNVLTLAAPLPGPLDPLVNMRRVYYQALLEHLYSVPIEQRSKVVDCAVTLLARHADDGGLEASNAFMQNLSAVPPEQLYKVYRAFQRTGKLREHHARLITFSDQWAGRALPDDIAPMAKSIMIQNRVYFRDERKPVLKQLLFGANYISTNDPMSARGDAFQRIIPLIEDDLKELRKKVHSDELAH